MTTVLQYQKFCKIPTGSTEMQYITEVAKLLELDIDKLNQTNLTSKVNDWITNIVATQKHHKKVKVNGKWYKVDRELYSIKFAQWITFDTIMTNSTTETIADDLHRIIAVFLRPVKYKLFTKKYNTNDHDFISKEVQSHMDIRVALELTNFFFHHTINFMTNGQKKSLEESEKAIWKVALG